MLKDLNLHPPNINERESLSPEAIQAVVDDIAQTFNPEKIILFGSYAYGQPKPWSDVDLLVVMETDTPKQKQKEIGLSIHAPFAMDILVWTPQEIARRIPLGDFFLREIVTKGKIIYERTKTPLHWSAIRMSDTPFGPNSYVMEWIQKAEADFNTATALLKLQTDIALTDIVCYHCQQCAEKYAKAYLVHHAIEFVRTHNLLELLAHCREHDEALAAIHPDMTLLNNYSVDVRYPGRFTSLEEAEDAVAAATNVRNIFRARLGL